MSFDVKEKDTDALKEIKDVFKRLSLNENDCPPESYYYDLDEPIKQFSLFDEDPGSVISN